MDNEEIIYALLDQGSTSSFCDKGLANLLQASGSQRCLALRTLTLPELLKTMSFSLSVQALNGGKWIEIPDVVVVDNTPVKPNAVPENEVLKNHEYLKDVHLHKIIQPSVKLLIGANVPQVFRLEEIKSTPNLRYPDAVKSPRGWSLLGPSMIGCLALANEEYSHQQLELTSSMFASGNADVFNQDLETAHSNEMISLEDQRSYKIMKESCTCTILHMSFVSVPLS